MKKKEVKVEDGGWGWHRKQRKSPPDGGGLHMLVGRAILRMKPSAHFRHEFHEAGLGARGGFFLDDTLARGGVDERNRRFQRGLGVGLGRGNANLFDGSSQAGLRDAVSQVPFGILADRFLELSVMRHSVSPYKVYMSMFFSE